jgi:hypothetical protein
MMTFNRIRFGILCLAILYLALFSGPVALNAQTTTQGAISGTVTDPTGAVVGGANITIHNTATNAEVALTTDGSGFFIESLLEPGTYSVSVSAPGFASYRAGSVIVVVGQVTSLLPHLAVASSSSQVVVSEQTPAINLTSPDFTDTLNNNALQSIPINNRRWSSLAMTTPGVVSDSAGYGLVSVRGISTLLNNVEIDGADDNQAFYSEERGRSRIAYSTSGGAVREFVMNTGVYSAEYGGAAGGVITSVTRSGTNQLHGQAYFWDRESNWNAMNNSSFLTNSSGAQTPFKPEDIRKIYGFTVGGPLIKNKLFFIYTYDQQTHVFPSASTTYNPKVYNAMPTAAALTSGTETCNLTTGALSGTALSLNDADACELAFRQGIPFIQASYDWAALTLGSTNVNMANYPGATAVTDLGMNADLNQLPGESGEYPRVGYQEINMPKLDWQINPKEHVSVLFNRMRWDSPGGTETNSVNKVAQDYMGNDFVKLDYGVIKLTSLITSSISNELLYQYGRELNDDGQVPFTAYTKQDIMSPSGNVPQISTSYYDGFSAGAPYFSFQKALPDERKWQVGDVLYWNKGNHNLKFGADMLHNYDVENDLYQGNGYFNYDYLGNYMNDLLNYKNNATPSGTGYGSKGCNSSAYENGTGATGRYPCYYQYTQGFGTPNFALSTMDYGIFAQDNWKATPRLTLELGLRWDYEALPPPFANLTSAMTQSGITFVPYASLFNTPSDKLNFGPRVGFSWDVYGGGNTVLRGGYGIYYGRITNGNIMQVRTGTGSPLGQINPLWHPNSSGAAVYPNYLSGNSNTIKPTSYFFSPNLRDPQVQEFDLMLQQEVGKGTVFQLSYLGALGRELPNYLDVNLNPASIVNDTITISDASGLGPLGPTGTTYPGIPTYTAYGNLTNPSLNNSAGTSVAGDYQSITEMVSNINSNYNAMVAEILNRSLKSIQFDASYTWSHALDYSQNTITQGSTNAWYDPYGNARTNYGNSTYDIPNRFVAYVLYNFPNLPTNSFAKYIINNWSLDDSFQMQNGRPWTAGVSGYTTNGIVSDWNGSGGSSVIPEIGINTMRYPRDIVDDVRLQKAITFAGGRSLQLILNAFNVANHQNYMSYVSTTAYTLKGYTATYQGQPSPSTNSGFGVLSNSNNSSWLYTPRQVEIAARLNF